MVTEKILKSILDELFSNHFEEFFSNVSHAGYITKSGHFITLPTEETMKFNDNDLGDIKELSFNEKEDLNELIGLCDGIILQGGMTSSAYEVECAKKVIELNKPLLGICAGFNNILRALGGDVIVDKNNKHNYLDKNYRHSIKIEKETELYKIIEKDSLEVIRSKVKFVKD